MEGAIAVLPYAEPIVGFDDYFLGLTPANNRRNPWFAEYWQDYFLCHLDDVNGTVETPFNQDYIGPCNNTSQLTRDNGFQLDPHLQFVSDAVLAFAYALKVGPHVSTSMRSNHNLANN